jgi:hypothetical protein
VLDESAEDGKLAAGEGDLGAPGIREPPRGNIELPARETVDASRRARGASGGDVERPSQHRLDAREQLAQVERLGDVVVGADLEADDLVDRVAAAGDDNQAALPVLAQLPGDREAILAWEAEVEQHQLRRVPGHQAEQRGAVVRLRDAITLCLQIVGQ